MKYRVVVHLTNGEVLEGVTDELDPNTVVALKRMLDKLGEMRTLTLPTDYGLIYVPVVGIEYVILCSNLQ